MTIAVIAAAVLIPTSAHGQQCLDRGGIVAHLGTKFSEAPVGRGVTNAMTVLELFTSRDGGTWTITVTLPDGRACLVAAGESWERVRFALKTGAEM